MSGELKDCRRPKCSRRPSAEANNMADICLPAARPPPLPLLQIIVDNCAGQIRQYRKVLMHDFGPSDACCWHLWGTMKNILQQSHPCLHIF